MLLILPTIVFTNQKYHSVEITGFSYSGTLIGIGGSSHQRGDPPRFLMKEENHTGGTNNCAKLFRSWE